MRGATKIYKRDCWEAIGGLWVAPGWDTIDEVKANMLGWTMPKLHEPHGSSPASDRNRREPVEGSG